MWGYLGYRFGGVLEWHLQIDVGSSACTPASPTPVAPAISSLIIGPEITVPYYPLSKFNNTRFLPPLLHARDAPYNYIVY